MNLQSGLLIESFGELTPGFCQTDRAPVGPTLSGGGVRWGGGPGVSSADPHGLEHEECVWPHEPPGAFASRSFSSQGLP